MDVIPLICIVLVAASLAAIFLLAAQSTGDTETLAWRVEQLLMRLVPPTGTGGVGEPTWYGLTIRRLAHLAEYVVLGVAMGLAAGNLLGWETRSAAVAAGLCALASLADETHKCFVPGRHFDPADLALDVLGYLPAILIAFGIAVLAARLR